MSTERERVLDSKLRAAGLKPGSVGIGAHNIHWAKFRHADGSYETIDSASSSDEQATAEIIEKAHALGF